MITTAKRLAKTLAGSKTNDAIARAMGNIDWERLDPTDDDTMALMARGLVGSPAELGLGLRHNLDQVIALTSLREGARKQQALAATAQLLWRQMAQVFELIPEMAHCDDEDFDLYVHQGLRGLCLVLEQDDQQRAAEHLWDEVDELDPEADVQWGET